MKNYQRNFIIIVICAFILSFCACSSEAKDVYEEGRLESGQSISDYYHVIGTENVVGTAMHGDNHSNTVYAIATQQTEDGGWVAWNDECQYYVYSPTAGESGVRLYLASILSKR